jgi:hypothetical protein
MEFGVDVSVCLVLSKRFSYSFNVVFQTNSLLMHVFELKYIIIINIYKYINITHTRMMTFEKLYNDHVALVVPNFFKVSSELILSLTFPFKN